jgi:hypothetical protein
MHYDDISSWVGIIYWRTFKEIAMKTRFDLEQDILDVTSMTKDLDTLLWRIMDSPDGPLTEDDLANIIIGLKYTLQLRGDKLWDTFCQTYELDNYRSANNDL